MFWFALFILKVFSTSSLVKFAPLTTLPSLSLNCIEPVLTYPNTKDPSSFFLLDGLIPLAFKIDSILSATTGSAIVIATSKVY